MKDELSRELDVFFDALESDKTHQQCSQYEAIFLKAFELGYDMDIFTDSFMKSRVVDALDIISKTQELPCSDEIWIDFMKEYPNLPIVRINLEPDAIAWAGYTYRAWHLLTGESSKDIYAQANIERMLTSYLGLHCEDTTLVVEDLKRIYLETGSSGAQLL